MEYQKYFLLYETEIPKGAGYSFFDGTHLSWMLSSFLGVILLVLLYRNTKRKNKRKFILSAAFILILCEVVRNGWLIWIGEYSLSESLPLQLSRIMVFMVAFAIFTDNRYLKEFSYACGLFSVAAFIAPDIMQYPILHLNTLRYTVAHILILSVPLMWIAGDGFRPDVRCLPKCALLLFGIAGIATAANFAFGGNYLHIHYIPEHVNIALGQPWYAFALLGAIVGFWFLTYLPWIIYSKLQLKKAVENDI